jgi:tRNA-Thr(GGU) m(6)t(6)A37 methyltransferase TsaA
MNITFKQIGTIYTPFTTKEDMPIQSKGANKAKGKIIINNKLSIGLKDLIGFSHIMIIYYFHKSNGYELLTKPFLDNVKRGVFSTRAPKRPNGIGISVVKLLNVEKNILFVENVDILNETPLLDIKPYISDFDIHEVQKNGWIENRIKDLNSVKSDKRFI